MSSPDTAENLEMSPSHGPEYTGTAAIPVGLSELCADEMRAQGLVVENLRGTSMRLRGPLLAFYKAVQQTRLASRIFIDLHQFEAHNDHDFYQAMVNLPWERHLGPEQRFVFEISGRAAPAPIRNERAPKVHEEIRTYRPKQRKQEQADFWAHSLHNARRSKDALVDAFLKSGDRRPSVDTESPDVRFAVHNNGGQFTVSVAVLPDPLHRRGYEGARGKAPLKENVAAAMLLRACHGGKTLQDFKAIIDPMCGSGSILLEAAAMLCDIAPALQRPASPFRKASDDSASLSQRAWLGHNHTLWDNQIRILRAKAKAGRQRVREEGQTELKGYDADRQTIHMAQARARKLGLDEILRFEIQNLADLDVTLPNTLIITNPPYGERLSDHRGARKLHTELGDVLRRSYPGDIERAVLLTGSQALAESTGLWAQKYHTIHNGALPCMLISADPAAKDGRARRSNPIPQDILEEVQSFSDRVQKREKHLSKYAERCNTDLYRVYDADLPNFNFSIDRYGRWLLVNEYEAPKTIEPALAQARLDAAIEQLPELLGVDPRHIVVKQRRPQGRGGEDRHQAWGQEGGRPLKLREFDQSFEVQLSGRLDTGIFLAHREARRWLLEHARGARVLNLFSYTGTASIAAAQGGARATLSVDHSGTYLDWSARNFELNNLRCDRRQNDHRFVKADVSEFLADPASAMRRSGLDIQSSKPQPFDIIVVDPPTYSKTRGQEDLDLERDHKDMLERCFALLKPGGKLLFSHHSKGLQPDLPTSDAHPGAWEDMSQKLCGEDFRKKNQKPAQQYWLYA